MSPGIIRPLGTEHERPSLNGKLAFIILYPFVSQYGPYRHGQIHFNPVTGLPVSGNYGITVIYLSFCVYTVDDDDNVLI